MKTISSAFSLSALFLLFSGCQKLHLRPNAVPFSAVWVDGTFIYCSVDDALNRNRCTVYKDGSGEILADGLFAVGDPSRAANKRELRYAGYRIHHLDRYIVLANSQKLWLKEALARDPTNQLPNNRLKALASSGREQATNCGRTSITRADDEVSNCARSAFESGKPFYILYSRPGQISYTSYGLAGDGGGNVFEVVYDMRGLLNFGLSKNAHSFDDNHIRVTTCSKPVVLGKTQEGILGCIQAINEKESALAAHRKPMDTTVCAITENPSAFNNRMVRIRGYASGNFEYSELSADGCSSSIWFEYANRDGPPGLIAYVTGGAEPGAEDSEGNRIIPIPLKLVENSSFSRFQKLMRARVEADARSEEANPDQYVFHRVTATFIGRIDGVSADVHSLHLKRNPTDEPDFLGFGQMGLFDAQFVLQSVENDAVLGTDPLIPRTE